MKKVIFLLIIFMGIQVAHAGIGFKIGPKIGYNASKLSLDMDSIKSQVKSGFSFGVFARIGKKFYVQPELYYTTQGGIFTSNITNWKQNVQLGSLDIPVLLGYSFINKLINVRVMVGPLASIVVNKSIKESGGVIEPITKADINTVNWGIQAGAGVDVWKLTLDLRYQYSFNQLIKSVENYSYNSHNNVFVVSLGFKFL